MRFRLVVHAHGHITSKHCLFYGTWFFSACLHRRSYLLHASIVHEAAKVVLNISVAKVFIYCSIFLRIYLRKLQHICVHVKWMELVDLCRESGLVAANFAICSLLNHARALYFRFELRRANVIYRSPRPAWMRQRSLKWNVEFGGNQPKIQYGRQPNSLLFYVKRVYLRVLTSDFGFERCVDVIYSYHELFPVYDIQYLRLLLAFFPW